MEGALAADGRHADAVAVAADAGDDARAAGAGSSGASGLAEAQRVEQRDRPRAHGEHVAQDAADAGRRALVGLDEGGVVVALHLEDADQRRRRCRPRRRSRPGRGSPAGRWSAACAARPSTICRSSARSTSPRRCRARPGSARGRGSRTMRSYSSGVSPCSATSSGVTAGLAHAERLEQASGTAAAPSVPPSARLDGALGMRHQAEHVAAVVEDAGDVARRAVRIGVVGHRRRRAVAEGDPVLVLEPVERRPRRRRSCRHGAPPAAGSPGRSRSRG